MSTPPGHEGAKQLGQLIGEWPDLRKIMKALQPHYVFVRRYLRTIPEHKDGFAYRTDAYVNGLFVADVKAVHANRYPQLDQDYLVQWRDGRAPEVSYYSGIPKRYRDVRAEIWRDIADFCTEFGHRGQYGCPDQLNHSYRDETDSRLPQEPPWPDEFARAVSIARRIAAQTAREI
ncbi:MAG: hypothetical protein E6I44_12095 [Chloroflexi bacterium]|nr:MAG: hypothetical protein E6I44_12095 [Chloroflexota bacterium]